MAADGSIVIDTRIDTKGINTGMKGISTALGGVLRAAGSVVKTLGAAFIGGSIINGIRGVIGEFDLMSSSIGGSVKSLSESFGALKGAFIQLIITAFTPLIPFIIQVVQWLTTLFTIVAQIIGALFGFQAGMSGVAKSASGAGKAVKQTAKEAKGALATFDQISVLAIPEKEEPDTGGGGGAGGGIPGLSKIDPELLKNVEEFKKKMLIFLDPVIKAFDRLKIALEPLKETIWKGLQWAYEHILVPLGEWVAGEAAPAFLDLVGAAAIILNDILIAIQPALQWLWDNFLLPAAQFAGDALIKFLEWVTENMKKMHEWILNNQKAWQIIVTILGIVALALLFILSPIALVIGAIIAIIAIIANWGAIWDWIKTKSSEIWQGIVNVWKAAAAWFKVTVLDPLENVFGIVLDAIKAAFMGTFNGIKVFVKSVINSIIDIINGMINGIVSGINTIIKSANSIGGIIPGFSAIATVAAPSIPHLATGAVIPANSSFLAVLGDQKSGKNIETPVDLMRQIFREELGNIKADIKVEFTGTLAELARQLKPKIDAENVRIGGSLVSSGVTR